MSISKEDVVASTKEDFFAFASEEFLRSMVVHGSQRGGKGAMVVTLYALSELKSRRVKLESDLAVLHLKRSYGSELSCKVAVDRRGTQVEFKLSDAVSC